MSLATQITTALSLWIETVVRTASAWLARAQDARRIAVSEDEADIFTFRFASKARSKDGDLPSCRIKLVEGGLDGPLPPEWAAAIRGASVELTLQSSRFVFRPLELPAKAAEFLDGIIRSQIDRLTPWNAADVVFRWTPPQGAADDHIALTVVATARTAATSLARIFLDLGAAGVEISPASSSERVVVYDQRVGGIAKSGRLRIALVAVLATTGVLAILSAGLGGFITDSYDSELQQTQRRIAERRAIARGNQNGSGGSPFDLLARRKQTVPSAVLVMEELSAILPDHTYTTEMRIEGDKLQITGLTQDAPSLIQILEQSRQFVAAGFFAPTTRAATEQRERFHIEMKIKLQSGSGT
ncbi:PilN domain-containing protein [Bradyrhizobium betae]|uniref:PilN domain-containing protein n=1 Tax=Bradyrhizobium betae TaxID=244734 RepID=A0A4V1P459_9BRAD|nr:PilN domain-containing protein [Bradyrhizobium betae]RXT36452.1 hypothetical protein B5V03_32845 [Bradyrhizobium betae]